jgi:hypothetical protein
LRKLRMSVSVGGFSFKRLTAYGGRLTVDGVYTVSRTNGIVVGVRVRMNSFLSEKPLGSCLHQKAQLRFFPMLSSLVVCNKIMDSGRPAHGMIMCWNDSKICAGAG